MKKESKVTQFDIEGLAKNMAKTVQHRMLEVVNQELFQVELLILILELIKEGQGGLCQKDREIFEGVKNYLTFPLISEFSVPTEMKSRVEVLWRLILNMDRAVISLESDLLSRKDSLENASVGC